MLVAGRPESPDVLGNARFPVNKGGLCVKGWSAARDARASRAADDAARSIGGRRLVAASWDAALDRIARALKDVQTAGTAATRSACSAAAR